MEELPKRVALQSKKNSKFLRFITQNSHHIHGNLRFSGAGAVSPCSKFEVECAKNTKGSLVHIRCSYNNKYWRREDSDDFMITASASEPNENRCDWACTLFEPIYVDGKDPKEGVRFRHVQSMYYLCLWQEGEHQNSCLYADSADHDSELSDVFSLIDLDSLVILPRIVTFKGNNGSYISSRVDENSTYVYVSANDPTAEDVPHNVFITDKGTVVIKALAHSASSDHGNFWEYKSSYINRSADKGLIASHLSPINTMNIPKEIQFEPIKVEDNKVALRCQGNKYPNSFCEIEPYSNGKVYIREASGRTISKLAIFEISEAIISREIYNIEYHLTYSKIHKHDPIIMSTVYAENSSSQPSSQVLRFTATDTTTTTWRNNVSFKLGVKMKFEGGIPQIVEGDVIISGEFNGTYTWGENKETTRTLENAYKLTVPAKSRMKVRMLASQVSCEVPFSYTQRDMLINGDIVTYKMDDGIYTYATSSNFNFRIGDAEPLV